MRQFDYNMLPVLGVRWERFSTEREAQRFARWAERETRGHRYPCEAFITRDDEAAPADRWEVKVRNW